MIAESRDALPVGRWEIVDVIDGFEGWKVHRDVLGLVRERGLRGFLGVLEMKKAEKSEKLWIFERNAKRNAGIKRDSVLSILPLTLLSMFRIQPTQLSTSRTTYSCVGDL